MAQELRNLNHGLQVARSNMKHLHRSATYLQQVLDTPSVFAQALIEGFRRRKFGEQFSKVSERFYSNIIT